ncbi:MAG: cytochrome c oxidase accessory protein CcoG [Rhodospirillales bacterium]
MDATLNLQRTDEPVERFDAQPVNAPARRSLYKKREPIHPKQVHGPFRKLKWIVMAVTLAIYYGAPWLRWDRGPSAPDQAILIDFPSRKFYFFFIEIWPQEVYYVTGLLILAALGLFLVTSLAGRVWCGYTCPQTVWTDLFIAVERLVEGDRGARIRLDKAPWTAAKIGKRIAKHAIWLVIAVCTGGAWVFYFADAPTLAVDLLRFDAPMTAYLFIGGLTFTTYALGGLMREQVCTYMCPWPRIQGALLDEDSLVVTYRPERGEPRGAYRKGASWEGRGHCIDCNACVAACPMGIDIRDGQQLECITCALCIDACDEVMGKVGLPKGLIAYDTLANMDRRAKGESTRLRIVRPRTILYAAVIAVVGLVMLGTLATRSTLDVSVLRDRNPLFVTLSDGSIRNAYTLKVLNKEHAERRFAVAVAGIDGARVDIVGAPDGEPVLSVGPDTVRSFRVLVTAPRGSVRESRDVEFVVTDPTDGRVARYDSYFWGPRR